MEEEEGLLREVVVLGVVYLVFSPCKEKTKETQEEKEIKRGSMHWNDFQTSILLLLFSKP